MASRELSIVMAVKGAQKAINQIKGVDKAVGGIGSTAKQGISTAAGNIQRLGFAAAGALVTAGVASAKWAADFEAQLNTINTIARATPEELTKIGDGIRALARETGSDLSDLTTGYYDVLSAGITDTAAALKVLEQASTLATGGLATNAEAVDLLTTAINAYGGDASQAARYTDVFAKAIESGKLTADELAGSFAQSAPLAASLGIEVEELGAGYAVLTAKGNAASEASTQMASAMTALLRTTGPMEKLQKQTGKNYAAIAGAKGLNVALEELRVDADKAGVQLIDLVGRKEALLYILQTTGPELGNYNKALTDMGNAAGTAAEQAGIRREGLAFQMQKLTALVRDAGITIGTALLPKLTPLVEKFAAFLALPSTQKAIGEFATELADAFETISDVIGRIPWGSVADAMRLMGQGAKFLLQAFTSLPPWVQTAVLTGWGLNKLSGGALGSIIGQVITKGIGAMAVKAGIVNVSGPVRGGGFGGGGGKGGGLPVGGAGAGGAAASGFLAPGALTLAVAAAVPLVMAYLPVLLKGKPGTGGPSPGGANAAFDGDAFNQQFMKSLSPALAQAAYPEQHQRSDADTRAKVDAVSVAVNSATGFVTGEQQATTAAVNAQTGFVTGSINQMDAAIVQAAASAEAGRTANTAALNGAVASIDKSTQAINAQTGFVTGEINQMDAAIVSSALNAERGRASVKAATDRVRDNVKSARDSITAKTGQVVTATNRAATIFQNKKLIVPAPKVYVRTTVSVSARDVTKKQNTTVHY